MYRFEDIRFRVKSKAGEKEILHGINGCVRSGEVLAILGPSGGREDVFNRCFNHGNEGWGELR